MGDASKKPSLNWWEARQVEKALTSELQQAREELRIAQLKMRESLAAYPDSVQTLDSSLIAKQFIAEAQRANDKHAKALRRWKEFVLKGVAPADLT